MMKRKVIFIFLFVVGIGLGYWFYVPISQSDNAGKQSNFPMGLFPFGAPLPLSQDELQKSLPDYYAVDIDSKTDKKAKVEGYLTKIQAVLAAKQGYPHNLDKVVLPFLRDTSVPRAEKLKILWDLCKIQDMASEQSQYLLDALAALQPIELTESLIELFNSNIPDARKIQLLNVLSDATGISTLAFMENKATTEEQRKYVVDRIEKVQEFIRQNLVTEANSGLFRNVYDAVTRNLPSDEVFAITSSLTQSQKNVIGQEKLIGVMVMNTFTNSEAMENQMPQLLASQFSSAAEKKLFNQQLYTTAMVFSADSIPDGSRRQLLEYLSNNLPGSNSASYSRDDDVAGFQWVSAYHKLSAGTPTEATKLLIDTVTQATNPLTQATIIISAPVDMGVASALARDDRWLNVQGGLQSALIDQNISVAGRDVIKDALNEMEQIGKSSSQK